MPGVIIILSYVKLRSREGGHTLRDGKTVYPSETQFTGRDDLAVKIGFIGTCESEWPKCWPNSARPSGYPRAWAGGYFILTSSHYFYSNECARQVLARSSDRSRGESVRGARAGLRVSIAGMRSAHCGLARRGPIRTQVFAERTPRSGLPIEVIRMSRLSMRRAGDPRAESAGTRATSPPLQAGRQCGRAGDRHHCVAERRGDLPLGASDGSHKTAPHRNRVG
jgi:hypothetical protein